MLKMWTRKGIASWWALALVGAWAAMGAEPDGEAQAGWANGAVKLPGGAKLEMVKIHAGTFTMGSPTDEDGRYDNETPHQVQLTQEYWMGKFEVTQGQWNAVMRSNPSKFQKGDDYPVERVSWEDAKKFCDALNELVKDKPEGYRFDLPTEAQWEYACRAGTTTALNNGKDLQDRRESAANAPGQPTTLNDGKGLALETGKSRNLDEVGWYRGNSGGATHPVGQKKPNAWGLHDMHGNVWEWCRDWHKDYPSTKKVVSDPMGPAAGTSRVRRGGGWYGGPSGCRAADRLGLAPDYRFDGLGFRLALVKA